MSVIVTIIKQLEATNSKLEKEAILLENKENTLLKELFRLSYSPTVNFNLKAIPMYTCSPLPDYTLATAVYDVTDEFITRGARGNKAKEYLVAVLSSLPEEEADILTRIFKSDMRVGCGKNTVNKVWKGLIQVPPRQGASSMNDKTLAKMEKVKNRVIELKSDGTYLSSVCGADTTLLTRNGNSPLIEPLAKHLSCGAFDGFALEGEAIFDLSKATREIGNGIIGKIIKGTGSYADKEGVLLQVWDCIALPFYESKGKYEVSNKERRLKLEGMYTNYLLWCESRGVKIKIMLIPRLEDVSMEQVNEIFEGYVRDGFEGGVVKDMDAGWSDNGKPTCSWKMKRKEPADLLVVGVYEGKGRAIGMLGGVNLESSCGRIKVNCGSGFSDEQRVSYWEEAGEDLTGLNGKVLETQYDSVTKDKKTLQESLFLPIFKLERFDKDVADSYQDIIDKQRIK